MNKYTSVIILLISSFMASSAARAQILIAHYPLTINKNDLTGNFGSMVFGNNGTPPPSMACANGTYTALSLNDGFGTFSTPSIEPLFNQSNFEIDFNFTPHSIPSGNLFPMPVITLGPSWRTIGVCISQTGLIGIIYNNDHYIFSTTTAVVGQSYSVSLQYLAPSYKLQIDNVIVLNSVLPALAFPPAGNGDLKLYAANGSNGTAFNGCLDSLKVYSCPVINASVSIAASQTNICKNDKVIFTASSQNEGTQPFYQWKVNGVNTGTNNSIFVDSNLDNDDVITCNLTSNSPCVAPTIVVSNAIKILVRTCSSFNCNNASIITNDTILCAGNPLQLMAKNSLTYSWSPGKDFDDSTIQDPLVTPATSKTYYLETFNIAGNLVDNGDFEQGNTAFTTTYTYCNSGNCLFPLANNGYSIGNNATFFHSLFQGKDHTYGAGNFMIINGADPNLNVWKKTINILPNTNYAFGIWISTMIVRNTAKIRFSINGVQLGPIFDAPQELNKWVQVYTTWNSGNNTTATIEIVDTYNEPNGNDFGLDDIFFGEVISCTDSVNIKALLPVKTNTTAFVCKGQNYILPSGIIVSNPGLYIDTVKSSFGCDSLITVLNLTVSAPVTTKVTTSICLGQTYTLPSGLIINTAGIYADTLKNSSGCDSLITAVNLKINSTTIVVANALICLGKTYTLPSGLVVNTEGIYNDTIKGTFGCDSLITVVNLGISAPVTNNITTSVCTGQTYTLPSGFVVNTAGTYIDTVKNILGCDSLITTVNLKSNSPTRVSASASICPGKTYTLPSGLIVHTDGIYNDTVKSTFGCDSLVTVVNSTVSAPVTKNLTASTCAGKIYTLPLGLPVSEAGIYLDTIRTVFGCDSVINKVDLTLTKTAVVNTNASICSNDIYTLPSGLTVNTTGIYNDTSRYSNGCDSLISIVNLKVNPIPNITINKSNDIDCILRSSKLTASGGNSYIWTPSSSLDNPAIYNPVATPGSTTVYTVSSTIQGCVAKDSIDVKVTTENASSDYFVPSAFTPNNDGKNDCFSVKSWGFVSNLNFSVFDRWGHLVFHTTDPSACWDGSYKGETLGTAAFVYQISAATNCGTIFRKGTVVLIR